MGEEMHGAVMAGWGFAGQLLEAGGLEVNREVSWADGGDLRRCAVELGIVEDRAWGCDCKCCHDKNVKIAGGCWRMWLGPSVSAWTYALCVACALP